MPAVSLIVPFCDKADPYLYECLDSIHAQTYDDIELIVVDDSQRTGAAAARNRGLAQASGDYIAFSDADDLLAPDAIEKMVAAMDGVDMVCGSFRKFGDFEQVITHPTMAFTKREVANYVICNLRNPELNGIITSCWAKMYRRRSIVTGFPLQTTSEGMAFNYKYLKGCEMVRFLEPVVYHHRKHNGTLTTTFDPNDKFGLFGFLQSMKYVRAFLEEFIGAEELDDALDSFKVYHAMMYFGRIMAQTGETPQDTLKRLYHK